MAQDPAASEPSECQAHTGGTAALAQPSSLANRASGRERGVMTPHRLERRVGQSQLLALAHRTLRDFEGLVEATVGTVGDRQRIEHQRMLAVGGDGLLRQAQGARSVADLGFVGAGEQVREIVENLGRRLAIRNELQYREPPGVSMRSSCMSDTVDSKTAASISPFSC